MKNNMKYSQIRDRDISNGIGIACSVFFQGCTHHCRGCFNPETWDFNGGYNWTNDIENKFIELCQDSHIKCISLLGGEPFDQGEHIYDLLKRIKNEVGKTVFVWSGYTFEQLMKDEIASKCLKEGLIDVLIDGEFQLNNRDLRLKLRGSTNQRVIDVKKTIKQNEIIWHECANNS